MCVNDPTDIHQNTAILVPLADAIQIAGAALIIDDEGGNLVPEAFFEHQHATNAAIAIFKGTDALETDMEIENLMEADIFLRFILLKQLIDGRGDLCRRCSFAELGCGGILAISGGNGSVTLMATALAEQGGLQLLDESLRQRLHGVGEDHIHAEEVVARFDNVVDLDGLFVGEDSVSFVKHFYLITSEPVAGHASIAVDHIDLQVFIEATIHSAVALFNKSFEKFRKLRSFLFLSGGLGGVLGYVPDAEFLISIRDAIIAAMPSDKLFRDIPFCCDFTCS